ncbi:AAA family ATPase [Streptomyces sp. NPDC052236]|uniref:AAA family ATPase n=1 Tax=Streptomyces sp. NPDC052236 TaxID=3365686 RepID=UPI0037D39B42
MGPEQGGRIGDRVSAARERAFVGRAVERELLRAALAQYPGAPTVLFLHGPGGIGKSSLLRMFALEASKAGRRVVLVDGRTVSPTPEGFAEAAGNLAQGPPAVLLVDTFEYSQGLEEWLREHFLQQLPYGTVVVIAGRNAPDPHWVADHGAACST